MYFVEKTEPRQCMKAMALAANKATTLLHCMRSHPIPLKQPRCPDETTNAGGTQLVDRVFSGRGKAFNDEGSQQSVTVPRKLSPRDWRKFGVICTSASATRGADLYPERSPLRPPGNEPESSFRTLFVHFRQNHRHFWA